MTYVVASSITLFFKPPSQTPPYVLCLITCFSLLLASQCKTKLRSTRGFHNVMQLLRGNVPQALGVGQGVVPQEADWCVVPGPKKAPETRHKDWNYSWEQTCSAYNHPWMYLTLLESFLLDRECPQLPAVVPVPQPKQLDTQFLPRPQWAPEIRQIHPHRDLVQHAYTDHV